MLHVSKNIFVPNNDYSCPVMGFEGGLTSAKKGHKEKIKIENKVYECILKSYTNAQRYFHRGKIVLSIPSLKKNLHLSFGSAGDWAWFENTKSNGH